MVSLSNAPLSRVLPAAPPRDAASVFISGHSLTDRPMPDHWAAIAHSLGTPLQWNRQYIEGSSIAARTRGSDPAATDWPGYRSGRNREGEGLDVIAELRNPTTITGRYDALVVTEQHALLGSLHRHDTLRCLRHLHDRLIEGNPMGTTYFYEPWLGLDDKTDPRRWVAYERAASPIWQGIVTRINTSLAAEGRADRIQSLPMGLAFAELIDLATRPAGLPDVSQFSVQATVNSLIADRVHPTDLGSYYAALVTHAMVYARSPIGAWHPKHIGADTARTLQRVAWEFVSHYRGTHYSASNVALTLDEVQARLRESFIGLYFGYVRDTYWREELGTARAWARWARHRREWLRRMANQDADNPFHFDAATDRAHWLPAP